MAEASQTFSHSEVEGISPFRDTPLSKPLPRSRSQFPLCKGVMLPQLWKFLHQLVSWLVPLPASSRVLLPLLWGAHWKALPKTATNSLAGAGGASLEQVVSNKRPRFLFPPDRQMGTQTTFHRLQRRYEWLPVLAFLIGVLSKISFETGI